MHLDLHYYPTDNVGYIGGGFKMGIESEMTFDRPDYGFKFKSYKGGHVSSSKQLDSNDLAHIDDKYKNFQNLVVECRSCKTLMEHAPSNGAIDIDSGFYRCPECGRIVRETTLYNQLDRENDDIIRDNPEFEDGYVLYDEDDDSWLEDL